jgi:hypothetical protein
MTLHCHVLTIRHFEEHIAESFGLTESPAMIKQV